MTYTPPRVQKTFAKGPKGQAKVLIHPSGTKVKVSLKDKEGSITEYILPRENCPKKLSSGVWFVSLSSDTTKMLGIHPWDGIFEVHTKEFVAAKDQPPRAKQHPQYPNLYTFSVLLEITKDAEHGMVIPLSLNYGFVPAQQEVNGKQRTVVGYADFSTSKYMLMLLDYMEVSGAWNKGPMPYKDNILPDLKIRILNEDQSFRVVIKAGYVQSIVGKSGAVLDIKDEFTPTIEE